MQNIDRFMKRLKRICKDVARVTHKKITVVKKGFSIEFDKTVLDRIAEPFINFVRNATDHGIETPDIREVCSKSHVGTIKLEAVQKSDVVEFTIADDGAGLNQETILTKAIEKGMVNPNSSLTEEDIHQLIMNLRFSTKNEVTEISGRGVGLDVVSE